MIPKPRIYISCPLEINLLPWMISAKEKILGKLTAAGFELLEFNVSGLPVAKGLTWSFNDVKKMMDSCQGALILAFVKYGFDNAHLMPSEYSHFEGAAALSKSLPTLIVSQTGVRNSGIVFQGGGKFINYIPDNNQSDVDNFLNSAGFNANLESWMNEVNNHSNIFFGYCSKAQSTADAIIKFLSKSLNVKVIDWAVDFGTGSTIMEEISTSIRTSRCGLFLFTADDPIEGDAQNASPRDNVIFEAGYCMAKKGSRKTIIIRENGAKMPADLGGSIYISLKDRNDISSIQEKLRNALEKNL